MGKFFPTSGINAKAREFLELKQGNMIVLEYVAKFTKLARFEDDYVATDMAKVRKFEDGLKLSIRGQIVGFLLQYMNSIVMTVMTIEREIEDARSIRVASTSEKRKEDQPFSSSRKRKKTSAPQVFQGRGHGYQGQGQTKASTQPGHMICYFYHQLGHMRRDCLKR